MHYKVFIFLLIGIACSSSAANSQNRWKEFEHLFTPPKNYVAYKTTSKLIIDGQLKEADWQNASWSEIFNDIEGDSKPKPLYKTHIKMLWDNENLYILAELEEPHVWAYYDKHDMIVYHENDFEVFIDPDRNTHNYYEFEVNAQNTLFDLFMNKPYRNGGRANIGWNAKGFKSAIHIDGTLNDPTDIDKKWTIEMKIPFAALTIDGSYLLPQNGDVWKINFSRVQWQTEHIDGKYTKKINPETGKHFPEDNWVWSPQGVINMHYPERWSMVQFSSNPVDGAKENFELPTEEKWAKHLWLVYYKQLQFIRKYGNYSPTLSQLDTPVSGIENGFSYELNLKTNERKFVASLKVENGLLISINNEGLFTVVAQ